MGREGGRVCAGERVEGLHLSRTTGGTGGGGQKFSSSRDLMK